MKCFHFEPCFCAHGPLDHCFECGESERAHEEIFDDDSSELDPDWMHTDSGPGWA